MSGGFDSGNGKLGHSALTSQPAPDVPVSGKSTRTAPALPRTTAEAGVIGPKIAGPPSVEHYSDMLATVLAAKSLTDHTNPDDPQAHEQILKLLEPVERRLGELNDHQGRLAQFGAGNIAGQAALDMSEAAIRSWRQLLALGAMVRTDELVMRFRAGREAIQFLTSEQQDAPTLREFNHVSRVVGMGAAAPILIPPLVALAAGEAPLLAFAARVSARRVALWAAPHPAAALAASEVLLGFGLQIGEGGWEGFWAQLHDPQGRWFVIAQVMMDYMHVRSNLGVHDGPASPSRPPPAGGEPAPDLESVRQRIKQARAALQQVHDAAASAEPAAPAHEPHTPEAAGRAAPTVPTTNTTSHQDRVTAPTDAAQPADAEGGPAKWVDENAHMSPGARGYQDSAHGARSNRTSHAPQAPELEYRAADGSIQKVRFDGVEGRQMIDRKKAVTTFPKSERQAQRQSQALEQNGLTAVWEVPSETEAARATRLLSKLNITNITVRVVKP